MRHLSTLVVFAATLGSATAQRAACTGTVTTPGGLPIAAAVVTFCQDPAQRLGAEPDRVEVRTDAAGAFAAEIERGSSYAVWAIGPPADRPENAQEPAQRWVTGLRLDGAAGRVLDLVAERRARPHEVELRGVDRWHDFVPPAVRVLLGGSFRCGHDLPIRGDGKVRLGPWPGREAVLALIDDKRQLLCTSQPLHDGTPSAHFPFARAVTLRAIDADGAPIAGAVVRVDHDRVGGSAGAASRSSSAVPPVPAPSWQQWRTTGRTDERGECRFPIPLLARKASRNVSMIATAPGREAGVAGLFNGYPSHDARRQASGWRFTVALPPTEAREVVLQGLAPDLRADLSTSARVAIDTAPGGRSRTAWLPAGRGGNQAVERVMGPDHSTTCRVRLRRTTPAGGAVPRVCIATVWGGDERPVIDFRSLIVRKLVIRDAAGAPAPFAHVCIALRRDPAEPQFEVHDRCIADAAGQLELWTTDATWDVAAVSGESWCWYRIPEGDRRNEHTLRLAPAPSATLRVCDDSGAPVHGARLGKQLDWRGRPEDPLIREIADAWLRHACSNREGTLRLPLLGAALREARITHGGRRSWRMTIAPADETVPVVIR